MATDILDQAAELQDFMVGVALTNIRTKPQQKVEKGTCYNCGEPIPKGAYCDADCRDDDERRKRR